MGETSGKEKDAGNTASSQGGKFFKVILVAVVVALVGCILAMYNQNMELSRELGEARVALRQINTKVMAAEANNIASNKGADNVAALQIETIMSLIKEETARTIKAVKDSNEGVLGNLSRAQSKFEDMVKKGEEFIKKLKKHPMLSSFF